MRGTAIEPDSYGPDGPRRLEARRTPSRVRRASPVPGVRSAGLWRSSHVERNPAAEGVAPTLTGAEPLAAEARPWVAPGEPIISLRGVTKSFGTHTVLEDITFDVPKGRITAIMGPSGTGKSVLLKNILGLLRPDRGQIWVDGDQIVGVREKRLYEIRKKFGVLFQDGALFGSMTL